MEPLYNVLEAVAFTNVVDDYGCDGSELSGAVPLIVGTSNGLKRFLAGGIPNLNLDVHIVELEHFRAELNPESGLVFHLIATLSEAQKDATLPNIYVDGIVLLSPMMMNLSR